MNRWVAVMGALVMMGASEAQAQFRQPRAPNKPPRYRPAPVYRMAPVSPYINLLRNDNKAFVYQGIIRPQLDANRFQQMQQQEINTINEDFRSQQAIDAQRFKQQQESINMLENFQAKSTETGHSTSFRNRGTFFPRYGNR